MKGNEKGGRDVESVYKKIFTGAAVFLTVFLMVRINIKAQNPGLMLIFAAAASLVFFT
ncbi:MAG: hypothetical protein XD50_0562 [Clostridia bacterium 41_269]|nr:MAG: hypothetical protein XD50_0562 [Clostridia bacterium 41_269]